jgi:hypothetical protein
LVPKVKTQVAKHLSLLLKRKPVSGVTLSDSDFALKQNTKLPTNTIKTNYKNITALTMVIRPIGLLNVYASWLSRLYG